MKNLRGWALIASMLVIVGTLISGSYAYGNWERANLEWKVDASAQELRSTEELSTTGRLEGIQCGIDRCYYFTKNAKYLLKLNRKYLIRRNKSGEPQLVEVK